MLCYLASSCVARSQPAFIDFFCIASGIFAYCPYDTLHTPLSEHRHPRPICFKSRSHCYPKRFWQKEKYRILFQTSSQLSKIQRMYSSTERFMYRVTFYKWSYTSPPRTNIFYKKAKVFIFQILLIVKSNLLNKASKVWKIRCINLASSAQCKM